MAPVARVRTEQEIQELATTFGLILRDVFAEVEVRLFGSYLKKAANVHSDVDFAIVSRDFCGMDGYTALKILNRLRLKIDPIVEPIAILPSELEDPQVGSVAYDIAKQNKLLFKASY